MKFDKNLKTKPQIVTKQKNLIRIVWELPIKMFVRFLQSVLRTWKGNAGWNHRRLFPPIGIKLQNTLKATNLFIIIVFIYTGSSDHNL